MPVGVQRLEFLVAVGVPTPHRSMGTYEEFDGQPGPLSRCSSSRIDALERPVSAHFFTFVPPREDLTPPLDWIISAPTPQELQLVLQTALGLREILTRRVDDQGGTVFA